MDADAQSYDVVDLLGRFERAVVSFCAEIEGYKEKREADFVAAVSASLAGLYAAALGLNNASGRSAKRRADTFAENKLWGWASDELESYLAYSDQYRKALFTYPDPDAKDETAEGCLANDLAFVYAYVKPVLGTESMAEAGLSFVEAVGDHAVDALRAIHYALYEDAIFDAHDDESNL